MKGIRQAIVAIALSGGLVGAAQAHVFVGFGVAGPVYPAMPVYAPPPVYYGPPPPAYHAPPPVYARPAYAAPVAAYYPPAYYWGGFYGHWRR